jgi:hypothetical protein
MRIPVISFGKWGHSGGYFFVRQRIYWRGWRWTPLCWAEKRYSSWLGYWRDGDTTSVK